MKELDILNDVANQEPTNRLKEADLEAGRPSPDAVAAARKVLEQDQKRRVKEFAEKVNALSKEYRCGMFIQQTEDNAYQIAYRAEL